MPIRNANSNKPTSNTTIKWSDTDVDTQLQDIGRLGLRKIGQRLLSDAGTFASPLPLDIQHLLDCLDDCETVDKPRTRRRHS